MPARLAGGRTRDRALRRAGGGTQWPTVATGGAASLPSPYVELDRAAWARLRDQTPLTLTEADLARAARARATGSTCARSRRSTCRCPGCSTSTSARPARCTRSRPQFLGEQPERTPFVIGVAGSVAVGKSTTARILRELLARWPETPRVELVTTDGFLLPNAELERRGLMQRKGFPESYDRRALLRFVAAVKSGQAEVARPGLLAPDLRHRARRARRGPPARRAHRRGPQRAAAAAGPGRRRQQPRRQRLLRLLDLRRRQAEDVRSWYVERFLRLRETAFADPRRTSTGTPR